MTKIKPPDSQTNPKGDSASCRHTPAMRKIRLGEKSKKEEDKKKGGGGGGRQGQQLCYVSGMMLSHFPSLFVAAGSSSD